MEIESILKLVDQTPTPQIKAGETHGFNDIWMVVAEGRIFCRQYSFGERSWYSAFMEDPKGNIKCDQVEIKIKAKVPEDLKVMGKKINEAYIEKYDRRLNHYPDIAHKMTGPKFMEKTMELVPILNN